jgi:hypothetical protein
MRAPTAGMPISTCPWKSRIAQQHSQRTKGPEHVCVQTLDEVTSSDQTEEWAHVHRYVHTGQHLRVCAWCVILRSLVTGQEISLKSAADVPLSTVSIGCKATAYAYSLRPLA